MHTIKGLIPKSLISDEAMGILTKKTEDFRKMTHQSSDIAGSILKIYETYLMQLPRIMGLLFTDQLIDNQSFYTCLRSIYLQIYKDQQNLTLDHIQSPTNQITNNNSSRYINFSNNVLTFQKLVKNYCSLELTALEVGKKYSKSQKALVSSIEAYKQSFTEAKLIYNIDEKIKRYSVCESNYKNVAQDHGMVTEAKEKLEQKKKEVISLFQTLAKQESIHENEVDLRIFSFLSKFNVSIYQSLKKRVNLYKTGKSKLELSRIPSFFGNFSLEDNQMETAQSSQGRGRRKAGNLSALSNKSQVDNALQLKKIFAKIQKYVEVKKNQHLRLYDFHQEFYRTAEKKCATQLKQAILALQKNQKKIKQNFCKETYEELKNTLVIIKSASDTYSQFQKKIGVKIQAAGEVMEQMKNLLKNLIQQVATITEKGSELTMDNQNVKERIVNIEEILKTYDLRLSTIFRDLKVIYTEILTFCEIGAMDSYEKCAEIAKNSLAAYEENMAHIKQFKSDKLKNSPLGEFLNPELAGKIIFDDDFEKNNDFKKLKKPTEIQILGKEKPAGSAEKQKQEAEKEQCMNDGEQKLEGSPSKKWKKHSDFIQAKANFVEGEEFKNAFSCALADKIILQGRLYVTTQRICFYSSFNPSNVFFGETFIQIPKKDILTLEKRKNGIFFDNSISITTVKGQLFLTSFFKRNEAFLLISEIIGINREDQAYQQDPNALQSDSSQVAQKLRIRPSPLDQIKVESKIEQPQQAEDDIKQSEITQRAESIQKMMDQLTYPFKQSAIGQFKFPGLTAYKVLQLFILDGEVTILGKKYPNINQYFKKVAQLHKQVQISSFTPAVKQHLNPNNIKSTCPLKLTRKISANVPTPNSGIPFVPKFTKASQKQSLYIISKHRWVLDNEVESSGAPYTDSFRVYYRTICDSTPESCKVITKIYIHFLKNVMVKNIIQSKTLEQSSLQFKKQYDQIRKYLLNQQKEKAKKQKLQSTPELQTHQSCPQKVVTVRQEVEADQNQRVIQLEEVICELKQKQEILQKQLRGQVQKYQRISIGLGILCLLALLALSF